MPKLDETEASNLLSNLQKIQTQVISGKTSWNEYFAVFKKKNQGYLIDFVQNTDLQKASTEDLIKANEAARQSALDHNAALKQQTLGAKAASAGLSLLKTAGNAVVFTAIMQAVSSMAEAIITKFKDIVNAYEDGIKKINDLTGEVKTLESEQSSLNNELKESEEKLLKLQQIKMPTLFEKDEIENLKEYNKHLETQIRLKELEIEKKKQEANEGAQKLYKDSQIDYDILVTYIDDDLEICEFTKILTDYGVTLSPETELEIKNLVLETLKQEIIGE